MVRSDDEKSPVQSEDQEQENGTETVSEQPAADEEADQGEQLEKTKGLKRRCPIDWSDQATFSPSKPKNFSTIGELEDSKKAKKKEQLVITKAAKAARRKQKQLAEKASHLTNEELLEIVQQRRHRQEEKAKKGKAKAKASAGKKASKVSRGSTS